MERYFLATIIIPGHKFFKLVKASSVAKAEEKVGSFIKEQQELEKGVWDAFDYVVEEAL